MTRIGTYVPDVLAILGATSATAGIDVILGAGAALIAAGTLMLAGAIVTARAGL